MRRSLVVFVIVGLLLAGCAGSRYQTEQLMVASALPGETGYAHPDGTLHYNSSGCVAIGDVVLVAPTGSSLIDDGIIVVAASALHETDRQFHVGEPLPAKVRGVQVNQGSRLLPSRPDCGASTYYVVT